MAVACPVCDGGPARAKLEKDGVSILECPACGLAFWVPEPGFAPERIYTREYFEGGEDAGYDNYELLAPTLRRTFADRIARLPRPTAGARLLDVGAAYGFAVDEATERGWSAFGLEISVDAAARTAALCPGRALVANALRLPFADATFDAVTLWDVLEHLADPRRAAQEVARILRPGGRLVLSTGDVRSAVARVSGARWHLYTIPEHLFFFSRRSLEILLERSGLRVETMVARGSRYPVGYLLERLRKTLLPRRSAPQRKRRLPGARLALPVNLFDIVTVTAVRA